MERGVIEADPRHTIRRIKKAIRGNVIRALVELITNSDDSYIRMEEENKGHDGLIEIVYKKESYCGLFAVRDHAEGMSIDEVRNGFKKYGAATSGLKAGKSVRGYFGQGAKDALASMAEGKICTFKDGYYTECKLFIEDDKPIYEISGPTLCNQVIRDTHKIYENGTVAYFKADPRNSVTVPQLNTVQEELSKNYLLRRIMTNPSRRIYLIDGETGKKRLLRYQFPQGREILSEDFSIQFSKYGSFPIHISIWRAERELTQIGDDRDGGLLITDDKNAVLDISLFKYENEPLASYFFGEVRIGQFRRLLENEEGVLREERDGLDVKHPFCSTVVTEIEKRLELKVREEKLRRQREAQSKIDIEESIRYKNAIRMINEIAELEAQTVTNLGTNLSDRIEDPPDGFSLYPKSANITVGKRYAFEIRLNTNIVRHGSIIRTSCSNPRIKILTPNIHISMDDGDGIIRKYITVEGSEPNVNGTLRAETSNRFSEAKISVIPEKKVLLDEGMVFQPESVTLRPNQPRKVYLLVYIKIIEDGSRIKISSDNESINVSDIEIVINESDAVRHVAKYEIEVWGDGDGQDGMITAECDEHIALLEVHIRSKEMDQKQGHKGMFSEPDFNFDPEPLQRTSYSEETGKVIIYVNFPSVQLYLGEDCKFKKTLPAQVMIADLVAERCFYEIAKKKVLNSGAVIRPEAVQDRIQRDAFELSRKYGRKLHEVLVDQNLLTQAKSLVNA
jgi:hypothetical protein